MGGNSWPNLSLILLSTAAVVADGMELSDAFGPSAEIGTSSVETDSMHGGWQTASRYSYWIPPLPEPNVSSDEIDCCALTLFLSESKYRTIDVFLTIR